MKLRALAPILLVLVSVAPFRAIGADTNAPVGGSSGAAPAAMKAPTPVWANGMVMDVDRKRAKVTLIHGPINNVGLGPLTRDFQVKDAAGLAKIKDGDRVRFQAEQVGADVSIVVIEVQKE